MKFLASHTGTAVISPNITSDRESGIGGWTDEMIRDAIIRGTLPGGRNMVGPMPWQSYAGMAETDVAALVAFVKTIPPIKNSAPKGQ